MKKNASKPIQKARFIPGVDYIIMPDKEAIQVVRAAEIPPEAIGGFHTLCADVGEIPGHPLSGFRAGDILPQSLWSSFHRPSCPDPRGFVYDPTFDVWIGIYLAMKDSKLLNLNYEDFLKWGNDHGTRLLTHEEFSSAANGSNEMTNIKGNSRPATSGAHVDQLGRRMISNIGCEDCCGALWQYLSTPHPVNPDWALVAGGYWSSGTHCGSRYRNAVYARGYSYSRIGARFASEPLHKRS